MNKFLKTTFITITIALVLINPLFGKADISEYREYCKKILASEPDFDSVFKDPKLGFLGKGYYKMLDGVSNGVDECFQLAVIFGERADGYQASEFHDSFARLLDSNPDKFIALLKRFNLPEETLISIFNVTDIYYHKEETTGLDIILMKRLESLNKIDISHNTKAKITNDLDNEISYYKTEHVLKHYEYKDKSKDYRLGVSSTMKSLSSNNTSYSLQNLFDNNITTAWCEGEAGVGLNKTFFIQVFIDEKYINRYLLDGITIELANGYLKNESIYTANSKPKELEIELRYNSSSVKINKNINLDNVYKPETQSIFLPINKNFDVKLRDLYIRIIIKDVYKGEKYEDLCISELRVTPVLRKL